MDELRKLRKDVGFSTQKDAASAFGVSQRTWQCWESGSVRVPYAVLELLRLKAMPHAQMTRIPVRNQSGFTHAAIGETAIVTEHVGDLIAVRAYDDGLPPYIQRGDVVIVDRSQEVYSGCIGLFESNGVQGFGKLEYLNGEKKIIGSRGYLHPTSAVVGMAIEIRRRVNSFA